MSPQPLSTTRRARTTCVLTAITIAVCAALLTAAVLVPAPLVVMPVLLPAAVALPVLIGYELPESVAVLRAARRNGLGRRHLARLRRELERLPETRHPLGL